MATPLTTLAPTTRNWRKRPADLPATWGPGVDGT
jgi:hypothetical protein